MPSYASHLRTADCHPVDPDGRQADADWHRLTVLAARPDPFVELKVVADADDSGQGLGAVANERGALHRRRDPSVLDQICLAGRENELAAGDIDLPASEVDGVEASRHGADDVTRIILPGEHERVGHPR